MAAIVAPPKTFSFMQPLGRGDLSIFISTPGAGPVSPYRVAYTLFEVRPDGSLKQVGGVRAPERGMTGEYYATGRAGELGQPGVWLIRWEYQYASTSPVETKEMTFRVEDAVLAKSPADLTVRVQKYGWN